MAQKSTPFELLLDMEQSCKNLISALPKVEKEVDSWSGIGFRLGHFLLVAPIDEITEILDEPIYTHIPWVKSWVIGISNIRGRLLPLFDLQSYLTGVPMSHHKHKRILVVETGEMFFGLIVDEIFGMQRFQLDSFLENPVKVNPEFTPYLYGAFEREHMWLVFSTMALCQHKTFIDIAA